MIQMKPSGQILDLATGAGKTVLGLSWYKKFHNGKPLLVICPASKKKTEDWEAMGVEMGVRLQTVSWHSLAKWCKANHAIDYVVIMDELQNSKGYSTGFGKMARYLAQVSQAWIGLSATLGNAWEKYVEYFVMTGKVKNKTQFMNRFVRLNPNVAFPMVIGYNEEATLKQWLKDITIHLTRKDMNDREDGMKLPGIKAIATYVDPPEDYVDIRKGMVNRDGKLFESDSEQRHYLHQISSDNKYVELPKLLAKHPEGSIIFYSYIKEKEHILDTIAQVRPEARIWQINGQKHEIPSIETWHKGDIVVANFKSGSESLNLQFIDHAIMLSLPYVFDTYTQAVGRVWRMGQTQQVTIDIIVAKHTINDAVVKSLHTGKNFNAGRYAVNKSY